MSCDPDNYFHVRGYIKARKPANVDSLKMRVIYDGTTTITKYSNSDEEGEEAYFDIREFCSSSDYYNGNGHFNIEISFFCGERKIELPKFSLDIEHKFYYSDEYIYYITEFDERKISGDYKIIEFLAPADTSCGKFVNYAVLKVEED